MKTTLTFLFAICLATCGGTQKRGQTQTTATTTEYGYKIIKTYPHDPGAYTQGLFWHNGGAGHTGALYESTGEYGSSTLRRVDLETGEPTLRIALGNEYFGEGAALLDGKIYQLTWLNEKGFVYDPATFQKTGEFTYKDEEGWGLTTDGAKLYMSDGSANITVRDPATFRTERTIAVRNAGRPVQMLNELEWIDGRIWANVYLTNRIVIIDPASGNVEGTIDFSGLIPQLTLAPDTDVMNGIAHDPATGRTWVTGKKWNKLFEIEVFKK